MEKKKCQKCHQRLDVSDYFPSSVSKDGYSAYCKKCKKISISSPDVKQCQGLPLWIHSDDWEIYCKSKLKSRNGLYHEVPCSPCIFRIKYANEWLEFCVDRFYKKFNYG